jgi:hypothetical protein
MGKMDLPYYTVRRNGRGFWEPSAKMRAMGFASVPCGEDGPGAWKIADKWNERWQRVRRGLEPSPDEARRPGAASTAVAAFRIYPRGSLGEAFSRYRRTVEWEKKAVRTREDWERAWRRIDPIFGDISPREITLEEVSEWRQLIEDKVSLREAHRAMKIWRALWKVSAALQYCDPKADPSQGVRNTAAKGRSATWSGGEAVRLVKRAWRLGYKGLAAALATMWDSQLSPGDIRLLLPPQIVWRGPKAEIVTKRGKTGVSVLGELGRRPTAMLKLYLASVKVDLHPAVALFRNRSGAPYSKDTMGDDFRDVRQVECGEHERRQMLDFRRSGAVEAIAGGAEAPALAHAMGNTLSTSNALFETYVPSNITTIRQVGDARKRGRTAIRENS